MKKILITTLLIIHSLIVQAHDEIDIKQAKSKLQEIRKQTLSQAKLLRKLFEDKDKIVTKFSSKERTNWTNLPVGMVKRQGVGVGDMTDAQRVAMHELLAVVLSSQGYFKVTGVMHLDNILEKHFNIPRLKWSHKNYYFSFWNEPSKDKEWGFKLEGHHLSLNFTFVDMSFSASPLFIGADPAEIRKTEYAGWKLLNQEESLGYALINSMTDSQKKKAVLDRKVPRDILTNPDSTERLTEFWGIKASELNAKQKTLLTNIIKEYINNVEPAYSETELNTIKKEGIDNIYFAWIGKTGKSDRNYYLIHGPSLIIEYDNHDNHTHTILRNKQNDFGEDILKKHLQLKHK